MPEISGRTLVMVVQAVAAEVRRLRSLPDEETMPGDEVLLVDYENAAEELAEAYAQARAADPGLPAWERLAGDT